MADTTGRLWAIGQVTARTIRSVPEMARGTKVAETFGCNTFDLATMRQKLPKASAQSLQETIRRGTRLDPSIANEVAHAVKEWALEKGATHFCHWFQPQTGLRCGCYFDWKTTGKNDCTPCQTSTDCPADRSACNYGFCEVN